MMNDPVEEQKIRDVVATWMHAAENGDASLLHDLMAEDAVFLLPGQPPMEGRENFIAVFKAALQHVRITGVPDIQEIQIFGDLAYCWNHLTVTVTLLQDDSVKQRKGFVLSIFRKEMDGRWVLFRDANLLTDVA
jgi:uncharacterized protein (TIGR02246 family)